MNKYEFVNKERCNGVWVSTYFSTMKEAKKLCRKILKAGGVAICRRSCI